ncbi:MAG: hypothetical protein R6U58_09035 [Bacteroidales bacterium]
MKIKSLILLSGIFSLCTILSSYSQTSFSAELVNVRDGTEIIYKLRSDGYRYRYDFEDSGMRGIIIVDPAKGQTAILIPDKKFVHHTDTDSQRSLMNDPYQSFLYMKTVYEEKSAGRETISGFECDKSELFASGRKIITAWYSGELNFLVKMVNNTSENTFMELRDIKPGMIDEDTYHIPEDYIEVDERMRPIIPEPEPPDTWSKTEHSIPLKGEFKRGDLIVLDIPESKNYKVSIINQTDDPAKIIRIAMREGKELSEDEQGPVSYRTERLYGKESSTNTYSWKAGDQKILQVHEGIIYIEILSEIR